MGRSRITPDHIDHYREHGYVIVRDFLTPQERKEVKDDLQVEFPQWVEYCEDPSRPKPEGGQFNFVPGRGVTRFPFKGPSLNHVGLHPELRQFASDMAGGNEVFCEQYCEDPSRPKPEGGQFNFVPPQQSAPKGITPSHFAGQPTTLARKDPSCMTTK